MNNQRFPLTRLPSPCSQNVLRIMTPAELLKLSLISKKAKDAVVSRNLKIREIEVFIGNEIEVILNFGHFSSITDFKFHMTHERGAPKRVQKPSYITFCEDSRYLVSKKFAWRNEKFEMKDWINHLKTIFNKKEMSIAFSQNAYQFDFNSIREHFKNPTCLRVHHTGNFEFNKKVFEYFLPMRHLSLDTEVFENRRVPNHILIQNLDRFTIMATRNEGNEDEIMRRIQHQVVPREQNERRIFRRACNGWEPCRGEGMDLYRFDGIKGTICILNLDQEVYFFFFVWYDHCIG
ncbi:hypothetical protein CAEBREN_15222 [Caenorhabditis brenneri]|uniref:F-box domain-containing protein n=1 Tax=Caenorhabditis brenneri TaxID=135651 RepID=G0N0B3_CAEBE|nr:hypothetical protein CAEBREN_15222 [Caenorhabditis brenneri]